jgi:hypothetical protein
MNGIGYVERRRSMTYGKSELGVGPETRHLPNPISLILSIRLVLCILFVS